MFTKEQQLSKKKVTKLRKKKCKVCKTWFERKSEWQQVCNNVDCAVTYAKLEIKKKQEQTKKAFRQTEKSKLRENAQYWFNRFIRLRDENEPCISCDYDWKENGNIRQEHASHYMSVSKSKKLRFNEYNVNKSCQQCNTHLSGNLVEYRLRLIKKIGLEKVERLEAIAKENKPCRYTSEDYKKIISIYKAKCKELE